MKSILLSLLLLTVPPVLTYPASIKWLPVVTNVPQMTVSEATQHVLPLQGSSVLLQGGNVTEAMLQ